MKKKQRRRSKRAEPRYRLLRLRVTEQEWLAVTARDRVQLDGFTRAFITAWTDGRNDAAAKIQLHHFSNRVRSVQHVLATLNATLNEARREVGLVNGSEPQLSDTPRRELPELT